MTAQRLEQRMMLYKRLNSVRAMISTAIYLGFDTAALESEKIMLYAEMRKVEFI